MWNLVLVLWKDILLKYLQKKYFSTAVGSLMHVVGSITKYLIQESGSEHIQIFTQGLKTYAAGARNCNPISACNFAIKSLSCAFILFTTT